MTKLAITAVLVLTVLLGCVRKQNDTAGKSEPQAQIPAGGVTQSSGTGSSSGAPSKYREVEYDFNGHSSEGGSIYAYFDGKQLVYFEVYLFAERGKVLYRFEQLDPATVSIKRTSYEYDKSVSEGDVVVVSQESEDFALKNGTDLVPKDNVAATVYEEAKKVVEAASK